jgi:hypothetical protein
MCDCMFFIFIFIFWVFTLSIAYLLQDGSGFKPNDEAKIILGYHEINHYLGCMEVAKVKHIFHGTKH